MAKIFLISGAVFLFLFVALGAFGSHALKDTLAEYGKSIWEKAVIYHAVHAIALLIIGILQHYFKNISFALSGYLFISGILLFSGSLYILALTQIKALGIITPIGGFCFLAGWAMLIYSLTKA